jgi:hypothetical protein
VVKIRTFQFQNFLDIAPDLASKANLLSQEREGGQIMYASPAIFCQSIGDNHALIEYRERAFMDQRGMDPNSQHKVQSTLDQHDQGLTLYTPLLSMPSHAIDLDKTMSKQ